MRRRRFITSPLSGLALPAAVAADPAPTTARRPGSAPPTAPGERVLRVAFSSPETTLDPPQTQSDQNTSILLAQIL